jgi:MOSC domain-containing protein YiiM
MVLRVNGECEPCTHIGEMNGVEDQEVFRQSLQGRRGAVCTVVEASGVARVGDRVEIVAPVAAG